MTEPILSYFAPFSLEFELQTDKADLLSILKCVLNTSDAHDQTIKKTIAIEDYVITSNQTWVITQYQLKILQTWQSLKSLTVTTRVVDANRFFITREFIVSHDGIQFITIYMQFAAIDFTTRKMARLNLKIFADEQSMQSITYDKLVLNDTLQLVSVEPLIIKETDIDTNHHVNNLVYLRWAIDLIKKSHDLVQLREIAIKYGKEVLFKHDVEMQTYQDAQTIVQTHQIIYNKTLDKEACHIVMKWQK